MVGQQVLKELEPEQSLDKFRSQYEKVLQAVRRSHGRLSLLLGVAASH